jgi:hypothetical protein
VLNRIMEAVKAMIHDQDIPMHLWEDTTNTVVYMHTIIPHKLIENKTLEEIVSREKLKVKHLRIFGCPVFVHVPKEKRTKLDPSRKNGILFGSSDT